MTYTLVATVRCKVWLDHTEHAFVPNVLGELDLGVVGRQRTRAVAESSSYESAFGSQTVAKEMYPVDEEDDKKVMTSSISQTLLIIRRCSAKC